jgi:hypothetical protein
VNQPTFGICISRMIVELAFGYIECHSLLRGYHDEAFPPFSVWPFENSIAARPTLKKLDYQGNQKNYQKL